MDKISFATLLNERITKVADKIRRYEEMVQPIGPENAIGRISRLDAMQNQSVIKAALQTARMQHAALTSMLGRVSDDGFGKCDRCGQPIPEGRLLLMPEVGQCVQCARR